GVNGPGRARLAIGSLRLAFAHAERDELEATAESAETRRRGMHTSEVTGEVVDGAIKVHRVMGPGLLESAYEACLCAELRRRGLGVETQVKLPVTYLEQR